MTLSCRETVVQLWAFHDDALSADAHAAVSHHLRGCAECRSHFGHAAEFLSALRDTPRVTPDAPEPVLAARVTAALAAEPFDE